MKTSNNKSEIKGLIKTNPYIINTAIKFVEIMIAFWIYELFAFSPIVSLIIFPIFFVVEVVMTWWLKGTFMQIMYALEVSAPDGSKLNLKEAFVAVIIKYLQIPFGLLIAIFVPGMRDKWYVMQGLKFRSYPTKAKIKKGERVSENAKGVIAHIQGTLSVGVIITIAVVSNVLQQIVNIDVGLNTPLEEQVNMLVILFIFLTLCSVYGIIDSVITKKVGSELYLKPFGYNIVDLKGNKPTWKQILIRQFTKHYIPSSVHWLSTNPDARYLYEVLSETVIVKHEKK